MRFVRELGSSERMELEGLHRAGGTHRERSRALAVLLSARGYEREVIADVLCVARDTVSGWLERFERVGVAGLRDGAKSGRPRKLDADALQLLAQALEAPTPALKPFLLERLKKGAL